MKVYVKRAYLYRGGGTPALFVMSQLYRTCVQSHRLAYVSRISMRKIVQRPAFIPGGARYIKEDTTKEWFHLVTSSITHLTVTLVNASLYYPFKWLSFTVPTSRVLVQSTLALVPLFLPVFPRCPVLFVSAWRSYRKTENHFRRSSPPVPWPTILSLFVLFRSGRCVCKWTIV